MVAPIVDKGWDTLTLHQNDGVGVYARYYDAKHRYSQTKPFSLILPYEAIYRTVTSWQRNYPWLAMPQYDANDTPPFNVNWVHVQNASYERLKDKIYNEIELGASLAEVGQAYSMIAKSATTLRKAYLAIRRGRFGDAAKALRMKFTPKGVSLHKSASANWLEYYFGWRPIVSDIYGACEILNNPIVGGQRVKAGRRDPYSIPTQSQNLGSVTRSWRLNGWIACTQGCQVRFARPGGLHTLDAWGIDNPLSVAWEVTPFSFVIDWFVNVGDFIGSQTDFADLSLENVFQSRRYELDLHGFVSVNPGFGNGEQNSSHTKYVYLVRTTSLSGIQLTIKKPLPWKSERAATAISLLVQLFLKR